MENRNGPVYAGIILEDTFILHQKQSPRCHVFLEEKGLSYKVSGSKNDKLCYEWLSVGDIVGCHCMRDKPRLEGPADGDDSNSPRHRYRKSRSAYICFYAYPLKKKRFGKSMHRHRTTVIFKIDHHSKFSENMAVAEKWRRSVRSLLQNYSAPVNTGTLSLGRKLLIFVNPHSGPGKALQIFQQRVVPILAEAEIAYQLLITDRANHARDYVRTANLQAWDGIVSVAGDGLLFEIFNGLMEREDWESSIQIPIGVIPGGSGNGLARAIGHMLGEPYLENMVLTSTLNLVSGCQKSMDLVRVQTPTQTLYSFLSIGWGLLADIDIESEKLRILGEPRFAIWGVARILGLRTYEGKLSFLPVEGYSYDLHCNQRPRNAKLVRSTTRYGENEMGEGRPSFHRVNSAPLHHSHTATSRLSYGSDVSEAASALEDCNAVDSVEIGWPADEASFGRSNMLCNSGPPSTLPPLGQPLPDDWTVIHDDFHLVYVVYQTHINSSMFIAPKAQMDDGLMWMIVIRTGVSRAQVLNFVLATETGEHADFSFVEMIPVRAFRLEPITDGGYITVDGEQVDYGPIQAEVLPSLAKILVR